MNKRCIISFANSRGNYLKSLDRLIESLNGRIDQTVDVHPFIGEESVGSELHINSPYEFKIHCWDIVKQSGYTSILWLDSSVYAVNDIMHLFDIIETDGYLMQEAGCYAGEWSSDRVLNYFDITRNHAMKITCYGNAGLLGLDFTKDIANSFFNKWAASMRAGMFKGEWNNDNKTESDDPRCKGSRHDLVCGSIIAAELNMRYQKGNEILQYAAPEDQPINDTICLYAAGM